MRLGAHVNRTRTTLTKAIYLNHMGDIVQGVAWADAIRRDFAAFRKAGLVNPLMTEIESSL